MDPSWRFQVLSGQTLDVYRFVRVHEWIRKTDCKGGGP